MFKPVRRMVCLLAMIISLPALAISHQLHIGDQVLDTTVEAKSLQQKGYGQWLVQFEEMVTEQLKSKVTATGAEILGYIPDNALLVYGEMSQLESVATARAVIAMKPSWKLSSGMKQTHVFNSQEIVEASVTTVGNDLDLSSDNLRVLYSKEGRHLVKGPRLEVLALADLDQVQRVEQVLFVVNQITAGLVVDNAAAGLQRNRVSSPGIPLHGWSETRINIGTALCNQAELQRTAG